MCVGAAASQELCDKAPVLPSDIQWHFIGHLQSNKVREGCGGLSCGRQEFLIQEQVHLSSWLVPPPVSIAEGLTATCVIVCNCVYCITCVMLIP